MSSILDALEKLESRRAQAGGPEPPRRSRRTATPLLAGAAAVAFVAGIGITAVWLRPTVPEEPAAPAPSAAPEAPAAPAPPPAAAAPDPEPPRPIEQPWAEVVSPPARREPAEAAAVAARPPTREPAAERPAPSEAVAAAAAPEPAPQPAADSAPEGAPSVRVSFLVYSAAPERRSVALTIDEAGLVTLREGEKANGLSVAQILPDGVELEWNGERFTIPAQN